MTHQPQRNTTAFTISTVKALSTFGNCQRSVFWPGVSKNYANKYKVIYVTVWFNLSSKLQENIDWKHLCCRNVFAFRSLIEMLQAWSLLIFEGAVSHNVLYYQRLSIARYHNANNYFEQLPIVSSAFNVETFSTFKWSTTWTICNRLTRIYLDASSAIWMCLLSELDDHILRGETLKAVDTFGNYSK